MAGYYENDDDNNFLASDGLDHIWGSNGGLDIFEAFPPLLIMGSVAEQSDL